MQKTDCRQRFAIGVYALLAIGGCFSQKSSTTGRSRGDLSSGHADSSKAENLSRQRARVANFSRESCADTSLAIVGGSQVKNLSQVARSTARLIATSGRCTATLVGRRHAITAAHCFAKKDARPLELRFGIDSEDPTTVIAVKKWLVHPQYKLGSVVPHNDIAVLFLASDIPKDMTPVPIAVEEDLSKGTEIIIAGYGSGSEDSQQGLPLSMTMVPLETVSDEGYFLTEIKGKGSCYGDSGGPGFVIDENTMCLRVAGVVSRASLLGDGKCGQGNTMMDTTYFRSWIEDSFAKLEAPVD